MRRHGNPPSAPPEIINHFWGYVAKELVRARIKYELLSICSRSAVTQDNEGGRGEKHVRESDSDSLGAAKQGKQNS